MTKVDTKVYVRHLPFDKVVFTREYFSHFKGVPKVNAASMPDLLHVLQMAEQDPTITDLRWIAYMLATVFIESSHTIKIVQTRKGKKGQIISGKVKVWRNFTPVEEKGHGSDRKYARPVKISRLPDGSARITEFDGEQWSISTTGRATPLRANQNLGTTPTAAATSTYECDDGEENYYYGRGYVQLTWWSNYASTGAFIGRGLDLLFEPDLVNEPALAYQIMSTGMRTGAGFANKKTFATYFQGGHTDYVNARAMVNGHSHAQEIASLAEKFEAVLLAATPEPAKAASG